MEVRERKVRRPLPLMTLAAMLAFALYFVALYAHREYLAHRFASEPVERTEGLVEELTKSSTRHGYIYYLLYGYKDEAGRFHERRAQVGRADWSSRQTGDPIGVEYLARDPSHSRLIHEALGGQYYLMLILVGGGAVGLLIGLSQRNSATSRTQHVRLPALLRPPAGDARLFRAYFREHWPIDLICIGIGGGLLAMMTLLPDAGATDDSFISHAFLGAAAIILIVTPLIFRFRFYVRVDSEGLESRQFGAARRIPWTEMSDIWLNKPSAYSSSATAVEFASPRTGLSINFKLFSRDCRSEVFRRIADYYGVTLS